MAKPLQGLRKTLEALHFRLRVATGSKPERPGFRQESTDLAAFQQSVKQRSYWQLCRDVSGRAELLRLRALSWRERLVDHLGRVEREMERLLPAKDRAQVLQKYGAVWKVEAVEAGKNREGFAWYQAEHEQGVHEIERYFELAKQQDQVLKAMEDELEARREAEPAEKL